MTDLYLSKHVFFCMTEGHAVFLDLGRDAYSAVPLPAQVPDKGVAISEAELMRALDPHVDELLMERLLTRAPTQGLGFFGYQAIPRPQVHLLHPDDDRLFGVNGPAARDVRIRSIDVADFFLASWRAARLLERQHISQIVAEVRSRQVANAASSTAVDTLQWQTRIFRKLRPWYPRAYLCLFDALALIEFLARRKHFPTWVFGVRAQPFGAHCWVQTDAALLNESRDYAGQYTPIMRV